MNIRISTTRHTRSLATCTGVFLLQVAITALAHAADNGLLIGNTKLGLTLDKDHNCALQSVVVRDAQFPSGGKFPGFLLFDEQGKEELLLPSDTRWHTSVAPTGNGLTVTYTFSGFVADVIYRIADDAIIISTVVKAEGDRKARALTDSGSLVSIPSNVPDAAATGFLIRPLKSGELIRFPDNKQQLSATAAQSWDYHATFFGLGYNGRGLIVRCPQFGAIWSTATGDLNGVYSLMGGLAADFRPRRDQPGPYSFWNLALADPQIDLVLSAVDDTNGDGQFNWVDVGVAYRQRFIRRNRFLDPTELISVGGKIDMWAAHPNYTELLQQIRAIDWAPQRWWLVGPTVPVGNDFTYPCYSDTPDPSHNGPGAYDYFQFKRDCAKLGTRIGIHEMFQDACEANAREWGKVPMRFTEYGGPMATFPGTTPAGVRWDFSKALAPAVKDNSFFRALDKHFKDWQVNAGDTWHWDCFTTFAGRADFHPDHPVTHGADFRTRIEVLKHIQKLGIHFSSEGLQEGFAEWCGFAWDARTDPGWTSSFTAGQAVPLVPILFQGTTYYYVSWHTPWNLLMGGKTGYEADAVKRDDLKNGYFGSTVFWAKIADRTVKNMIQTPNGWRVEYTEGGSLTVDLAGMTPAMTFVLEIDGVKYTIDNPPQSPWGVGARRDPASGTYELVYPADWQKHRMTATGT